MRAMGTPRRPRRTRSALTFVAALATAATITAPPVAAAADAGTAAAGSASRTITTHEFTAKEREQALSYWTEKRMRQVGRDLDLGRTGPLTHPWKGVEMPTVGRLFFVNADGADTWCTATAVDSRNRSVVMAAAHCVRRGSSIPENYSSTMVFVPGYNRGERPYGAFAARATLTPDSWTKESVNDVAAIVVDRGYRGKLTEQVGGQAIAFDRKTGGNITAFGYPATRPQRGEELLYCSGTAKSAPDNEQRIPCDMSGGASGGPWLADLDEHTGLGTLVSVNSHGNGLDHSTRMYGPVLGTAAREVYDLAAGM
ncbi:peptidase [Nocardiopsis gilva YIM 90087]|uniref:Peptidase n=1 Tax=Nocardiopsis gilva YIM 90087 TaxID=1235441 RepID=A0A223S6R5_9ACTN|nr:hypothetical protein [Nocardiopsis gilva]ASU83811.1 peptidase [Nocardiopsis gilva YIM 90087]